MSLWICSDCTTAYSVGAPRCPQCGSTDYKAEHELEAAAADFPTRSASKAAWVEHAVLLGWQPEDADALTKEDLITALTKGDDED